MVVAKIKWNNEGDIHAQYEYILFHMKKEENLHNPVPDLIPDTEKVDSNEQAEDSSSICHEWECRIGLLLGQNLNCSVEEKDHICKSKRSICRFRIEWTPTPLK